MPPNATTGKQTLLRVVSAGAGALLWRQWKSHGDLRFGENQDTVSEKIALPPARVSLWFHRSCCLSHLVSARRKHIGTAEFVATGAVGIEYNFPLFALLLKWLLQDWDQSILKYSGKWQKGAGNLMQAYRVNLCWALVETQDAAKIATVFV